MKVVHVRIGSGASQQRQHLAITSIREHRLPQGRIALLVGGVHSRTRRQERADSRAILLMTKETGAPPLAGRNLTDR
ncbi:hypothetical protein AB0L42_00085 [Streptomyces sp. NPDC052287]|uniref:hypothetical protein n=1 Tax=Streptomyces sp. NPDC052287 TaxID=3154950 RepID=UPI003421DA02